MFTWLKKWFTDICEHDYQTLYQDDYRSIERCTKCNDEKLYGDRH